MDKPEAEVKRYNLALPPAMFDDVGSIADQESTTMLEVIRRFLKLGMLIYNAQRRGAKFYIREDDKETEVVLIL